MPNSYLLSNLNPDMRRIVEDIYERINRVNNQVKGTVKTKEIKKKEVGTQQIQIIAGLNQFDSVTGSGHIDLTKLENTLDNLRIGVNSALNALRQLTKGK